MIRFMVSVRCVQKNEASFLTEILLLFVKENVQLYLCSFMVGYQANITFTFTAQYSRRRCSSSTTHYYLLYVRPVYIYQSPAMSGEGKNCVVLHYLYYLHHSLNPLSQEITEWFLYPYCLVVFLQEITLRHRHDVLRLDV